MTFIDHNHDHNACRREAVERAELICTQRSVRLTDIRKRVFELSGAGINHWVPMRFWMLCKKNVAALSRQRSIEP